MEHRSISGVARRRHAVEGVSAGLDSREEVNGITDTEEVPRLGLGKLLAHPPDDGAELVLLQCSPDSETVEVQTGEPLRSLPAKILVLRTLHDTEQCLVRAM